MKRHSLGIQGEEIAARFLKKKGYKVLTRNYRTRMGEIDIIAKKNHTLCFVEVRTRRSDRFGAAGESIDRKKRRHLEQTALHYLQSVLPWEGEIRFDVVTITFSEDPPLIELFPNAFEVGL